MRCYICNYNPHTMNQDFEYIRGPEMHIDPHNGKDICHKCHGVIQDTILEDQINAILEESDDDTSTPDVGASVQEVQGTSS